MSAAFIQRVIADANRTRDRLIPKAERAQYRVYCKRGGDSDEWLIAFAALTHLRESLENGRAVISNYCAPWFEVRQ